MAAASDKKITVIPVGNCGLFRTDGTKLEIDEVISKFHVDIFPKIHDAAINDFGAGTLGDILVIDLRILSEDDVDEVVRNQLAKKNPDSPLILIVLLHSRFNTARVESLINNLEKSGIVSRDEITLHQSHTRKGFREWYDSISAAIGSAGDESFVIPPFPDIIKSDE